MNRRREYWLLRLLMFVSSSNFGAGKHRSRDMGLKHLQRWKKKEEEKKKTPELLPSTDITSPACNKHPSSYYYIVASRAWFLFILIQLTTIGY